MSGQRTPVAHSHVLSLLITCTLLSSLAGCLSSGGGSAPDDDNTGNAPPSISGIPEETLLVGEPFSFRPRASDPNGDSLAFTIENRPGWALFDPATGELAGTPAQGDEGRYDDIRITTSDGTNSAAISFSLVVALAGSASVSLSWTPPTTNEDGSALTDLAGYFIYYGTEDGDYPNRVEIDNPSVSTYLVEGLAPLTYYFVATSYNESNVESEQSDSVAILAR